jgi:hypothetical protein
LGCGNTSVSARIANPHAVAVAAETPKSERVLPAIASPYRADLPGTGGWWVRRDARGTLSFGHGDELHEKLFDTSDVLRIEPNARGTGTSDWLWDSREFRARYSFRYAPTSGSSLTNTGSATLSTPWWNVLELREHRVLDRSSGRAALIMGVLCVAVGTLVFTSGVIEPHARWVPGSTRIVAGAVVLVGGGLMLGFGAYNAFAPEERVLYKHPRGPEAP